MPAVSTILHSLIQTIKQLSRFYDLRRPCLLPCTLLDPVYTIPCLTDVCLLVSALYASEVYVTAASSRCQGL